MVYPDLRKEDLPKKYLEISVWSFNIYDAHEFMGQVIIHLSGEQKNAELWSEGRMSELLFLRNFD